MSQQSKKKLDARTLRYIAHAFGRHYANAGEVEALTSADADNAAANANDDSSVSSSDSSSNASPYLSPDASADASDATDSSAQADAQDASENAPNASQMDDSNSTALDRMPETPQDAPAPQPLDMEGAAQAEKNANTAYADAVSKMGSDEAAAYGNFQAQMKKLPSYEQLFKDNQAKDEALQKAYESKTIDPNRYFHNMSTGQKVSTGIGMILSAGGGALAHQAPIAQQMIQKAIDRDIDAQKNDQTHAMNLWKMNQLEYGNHVAATAATQNQLLTGLKAQINMAAANAKGPLAQARAQALNAGIDSKMAMNRAVIGLGATLQGQTKDATNEGAFQQALAVSQRVSPEMYKDAQQRYVPGLGVARVPLDKEARNSLEMNQEYTDLLSRAEAFQKSLPLNRAAWSSSQRAEAQALKQQFDEMGTRAQGINRLNKEEISLADNAFNPGAWSYSNPLQAINTLKQGATDRKALLMKQYSITPFAGGQASGSAPQIQTMNGVQYEKVPGGWKRVQ